MLATTRHGDPVPGRPPLLIAHGLYGSARNWGRIARDLKAGREVLAVDMRNHGESQWTDTHSYEGMADDLAEVIGAEPGGRADVLGHSMGGKAAMVLALRQPDLVRRLIVADIAPVAYGHDQMQFLRAMQGLDLTGVSSRGEADQALAAGVEDPGIRAFLLTSLDVPAKRWRLNLATLGREMAQIMGFPDTGEARFEGPVMVLAGGASDYVAEGHHGAIRARFPAAAFQTLHGAGHWLHAEQPAAFSEAVAAFLDAA